MAKRKNKKETRKEIEDRGSSKKEILINQNRILKNFLIVMVGIIVLILIFVFAVKSINSFEYRGVEFKIVKFCDAGPCLVTYNTKLPVIYQGKNTTYNFYLRNDPRKLAEKVPFDGSLLLRKNMFVKITFDNYCKGFESIAVENFLNLHRIADINVSSGENTSCDLTGRNMYVLIQEADRTYIEQTGPVCYNINIKNCEILEGTERFMIETFIKLNKIV